MHGPTRGDIYGINFEVIEDYFNYIEVIDDSKTALCASLVFASLVISDSTKLV